MMDKKQPHKIPWEPYKAATTDARRNRRKPHHHSISSASMSTPTTTTEAKSPLAHVTTSPNLIPYKIDTDLTLFNAQRPGYQFDDLDLPPPAVQGNSPAKFLDARYYPDVHFMKLANKLKQNYLNTSATEASVAVATDKPISVVSPLQKEKMPLQISSSLLIPEDLLDESSLKLTQLPTTPTTTTSAAPITTDNSNYSLRLWKLHRKQYEDRISYLESQLRGFYEQLQMQTQVNAELKKLLVASIGDDIQYKIERLVNDKQRFELELNNNTRYLEQMSEEMEQVTIQCDLWRSKFLASKLMSDEMSAWKSFLLMLNRQNTHIVHELLEDNARVHAKLNEILALVNYQQPTSDDKKQPKCLNNFKMLDLIANELRENKLTTTASTLQQPVFARSFTKSEILADAMLEQFDWIKASLSSDKSSRNNEQQDEECDDGLLSLNTLNALEKLIAQIRLQQTRTHKRIYVSALEEAVDADSYTLLNVCKHCRGKIKIV